MTLLLIGLTIFIGIHLLPSFSSVREKLVNRYSLNTYKAGFTLVAALGLVLIILGHLGAPGIPLWIPPVWGRLAAHIIMLPALILFVAAKMPGNIKRYTRHPMLWGVTLWAAGHILANGDQASLIIFISIGSFALFDMVLANRRGAAYSQERKPITRDLLVVVVGVIVYLAILTIHPMSSALRLV